MNLKKAVLFVLPAAAAAGAAAFLLKKKPTGEKEALPAKGKAAEAPVIRNAKEAEYSFISGFKDAARVDITFPYDADKFSYEQSQDQFLVESGDSHVGLLYGDGYNMQFEYAPFKEDEDFEVLKKKYAVRFSNCAPAVYGNNKGIRYLDGEDLCFCFPVPDDAYSFLLITLIKAKDNDADILSLPAEPNVTAMLSGLKIARE